MSDEINTQPGDGTQEPTAPAPDGVFEVQDDGLQVHEDGELGMEESSAEAILVLESERRDPGSDAVAAQGLGGAYRVQTGTPVDDARWLELEQMPTATYLCAPITGNDAHTELLTKAIREYGKGKGNIPHSKMSEVGPIILAKTVFLGIRGFHLGSGQPLVRKDDMGKETSRIFASGKAGEFRDSVRCVIWINNKRRTATLTFALDEDGTIKDSELNRKRILQAFPEIKDEAYRAAGDKGNFPGMAAANDEEDRGN